MNAADPVRIVVIDRHPVVAAGLRYALNRAPNLTVVGEAHDIATGLREVAQSQPDLVITELDLGHDDGIQLIKKLRQSRKDLIIVALSDRTTLVVSAVRAGAQGFLTKNSSLDEIARAISQAVNGAPAVSPSALPILLSEVSQPHGAATLSPREIEVLRLVASGLSNMEIAKKLFLTQATVKTHLRRVFRKLAVNDRAAAVASALSAGLLEGWTREDDTKRRGDCATSTSRSPGWLA
ncbi:DNA-binding response regulator [Longimycelium tulufanense]|uniref:DNA-binding response regulator n=1 Tax=Longimycelium tulufanense TaxID=907463 RepID=A0A8J3CKF3_9PSEU|nr:response regulator transcription factor [Longimycelium tulufanense]GGM81766.1 DNA-binding response regulator [Longimycelium tulufanense]